MSSLSHFAAVFIDCTLIHSLNTYTTHRVDIKFSLKNSILPSIQSYVKSFNNHYIILLTTHLAKTILLNKKNVSILDNLIVKPNQISSSQ